MKFSGVISPLMTPFNEDGSINFDAMGDNLKAWNTWPVDGCVVNGSGGEFPHTTLDEQCALVKYVKERTPKFVVACVPPEGTRCAIEACKRAGEAGADGALVFVPFYWRDALSDDILIDHFKAVADASPIPILMYANPPSTLAELSMNVCLKLADHPNIVGVKDSAADVSKLGRMAQLTKDKDFAVLVGRDTLLLPGHLLGCAGGIVGMSTSMGKHHGEMMRLAAEGKYKEATKIHHKIADVAAAVVSLPVIPALKALMDIHGLYGGPPRAPLRSIDSKGRKVLKEALEAAGMSPDH